MATKSLVLTASGAVNTKSGRLYGVAITAGTDAATVIIKDGGTSGTQKTAKLVAGTGASMYQSFPNGIQCSTSIYATITGATPDVMVEFDD